MQANAYLGIIASLGSGSKAQALLDSSPLQVGNLRKRQILLVGRVFDREAQVHGLVATMRRMSGSSLVRRNLREIQLAREWCGGLTAAGKVICICRRPGLLRCADAEQL